MLSCIASLNAWNLFCLQVRSELPYHVRVVIPCYKEPLDVIQKTVLAALYAQLPTGCSRTGGLLYLCKC